MKDVDPNCTNSRDVLHRLVLAKTQDRANYITSRPQQTQTIQKNSVTSNGQSAHSTAAYRGQVAIVRVSACKTELHHKARVYMTNHRQRLLPHY